MTCTSKKDTNKSISIYLQKSSIYRQCHSLLYVYNIQNMDKTERERKTYHISCNSPPLLFQHNANTGLDALYRYHLSVDSLASFVMC